MLKPMPPTPEAFDDLVTRLRSVVEPKKVYLFGSCARGDVREHSDIDVLVVVSDDIDLVRANIEAYERMRGFGYPVDILYVNESRFQRHSKTPGFVYKEVLKEGRELYAAAA